jgi:hypothetical protein
MKKRALIFAAIIGLSGCAETVVPKALDSTPLVEGTNEPANFQQLTERDFAAKVENNWLDRGDPYFSIQTEPTGPRPDEAVGQALFPAGFAAGSGPIMTYFNVAVARTKLYVQFYFRVSSNWQGQQAGINKVLFLWHGAGPSVYLTVGGQGSGPLYFRVNTQFPSTIQTKDFSFGNPSFGGTAIECVRGTWYLWEVLLESNTTANTPDGRIRSWINGTQLTDSNIEVPAQDAFPGLIMWETGKSPNWTQVSWNPTWGGVGGTVTNNMFQQIDFLRVSGSP